MRTARELQTLEGFDAARTQGLNEPLQLFIQRAIALMDQGFAQRAIHELGRLARTTGSAVSRARILMHEATAWLRLDDYARTARCYRESKQLLVGARPSELEKCIQSDLEFLVESKLARIAGRHIGQCEETADYVARRWEQRIPNAAAEMSLLEVTIEASDVSHLKLCSSAARRYFDRAIDLARRLETVRTDLSISLKLAAGWYAATSVHEAYWQCLCAFEQGVATGYPEGALVASICLANILSQRQDVERASHYARRVMEIARGMEGTNWLVTAVAYAGRHILGTDSWSTLDPMLFEMESLCQPGTSTWMRLKDTQAMFLVKTGRVADALVALTTAEAQGKLAGDTISHAKVLSHLANLSQRLGHLGQAIEYARSAVALAGEEGLPPFNADLRVASRLMRAARGSMPKQGATTRR